MKLQKLLYICPMKLQDAKHTFIQNWGALATQWGINKTMAQIHALLMVSDEALSMEEIMEELQISRGNASMNLRSLIDWGIVFKELKPGERKEYFTSEDDINEMARKIAVERSKREIKPILRVIKDVKNVDEKNTASKKFISKMNELQEFIGLADNLLDKATSVQGNWLTKNLLKLFK